MRKNRFPESAESELHDSELPSTELAALGISATGPISEACERKQRRSSTDELNMKAQVPTQEWKGVARDLTNRRAYIDRIKFNVYDSAPSKSKRPGQDGIGVLRTSRVRIGGPKRHYGWVQNGVCITAGNPFGLYYARNPHFRNLPAQKLEFHSEGQPLTSAQCELAARGILGGDFELRPSYVELTFDIEHTDDWAASFFRRFSNHLFTSARNFEEMGETGPRTQYFGAPTSKWRLTVYEKHPTVLRVELSLKLPFLKAVGIFEAPDILRLAELDLHKMFRFQTFKSGALATIKLPRRLSLWQEQIVRKWRFRDQALATILPRSFGIDSAALLTESPYQRLVDHMLKGLVW
jgi:hypothetical protein